MVVEGREHADQEVGVAADPGVAGVDGIGEGTSVEDEVLDRSEASLENSVGRPFPLRDVEPTAMHREDEGVGGQTEPDPRSEPADLPATFPTRFAGETGCDMARVT